VEFQLAEVARIAAEAMDGYFLFKQRLTVKLVPPSKLHPLLFKGANRKFKVIPWRSVERKRHEKERTPEEHAQRIAKLIRRDKQRQAKIKKAGMDYEYEPLAAPLKPQKVVFEDS
jgi:nucleolar protein 15